MKWINKTTFQVTEDTPVRTLRGLTRKESKQSILLIQNGLSERRRQVQQEFEKNKKELLENLEQELLTQEGYEETLSLLDKSCRTNVRMISQFLGANITNQHVDRMANLLTIQGQQEFEYNHIKIIVKDFDFDAEYDNLTQGEVIDIISTITQLTNLPKEKLEELGFLPDSPGQSTANGAAESVEASGLTESETVTTQ